jgi:hypothetical protein
MEPSADGAEPVSGFDYFVVRLSRSGNPPSRVSGLVERLGSGEKRWFETGEHLLRLVTLWSDPNVDHDEGATGPDPGAG